MKRLHVHIAVENLNDSIRFYSALFAVAPTITKGDYAKWMLEDPHVNFAISERGQTPGLDHLGIQADSADELAELGQRMQDAALPHRAEPGSNCCYARSNKHWSLDPSGIPWETFHTLEAIPTYGSNARAVTVPPEVAASTPTPVPTSTARCGTAGKAATACC